jgi:hypothetical protein
MSEFGLWNLHFFHAKREEVCCGALAQMASAYFTTFLLLAVAPAAFSVIGDVPVKNRLSRINVCGCAVKM